MTAPDLPLRPPLGPTAARKRLARRARILARRDGQRGGYIGRFIEEADGWIRRMLAESPAEHTYVISPEVYARLKAMSDSGELDPPPLRPDQISTEEP